MSNDPWAATRVLLASVIASLCRHGWQIDEADQFNIEGWCESADAPDGEVSRAVAGLAGFVFAHAEGADWWPDLERCLVDLSCSPEQMAARLDSRNTESDATIARHVVGRYNPRGI